MTARLLDPRDLAGAAELERLCFANPWSENSLGLLLRDGNFGVVTTDSGGVDTKTRDEKSDRVSGSPQESGKESAIICAYTGLIVAMDEGEITNVATHPDFRRRGCAEAALAFLLTEAASRGVTRVTLEVRESNAPARRLYEKLGFTLCGKRRNFYSNPREDALVLERGTRERLGGF